MPALNESDDTEGEHEVAQAAETRRLARLRELVVLDTPPEPLFDHLVRMAARVCGTPIAVISLVDAERQWFKAQVGLPGLGGTPRDIAFCAHAITGDTILEVPDATLDTRFAGNVLVIEPPAIRYFAGAPLVLPGGERIGALCVVDHVPGRLDDAQRQTLRELAEATVHALLMRRDAIERALAARAPDDALLARSESRYRAVVEVQSELVSLARRDGTLVYVNAAYARHFGCTPEAMVGTDLFGYVEPADRDAVRAHLEAVFETGSARSNENRMQAADGSERWVAWTNGLQRDIDGRMLLHSVGRDVTERRRAELALHESRTLLDRTGRVAGVGGWQFDIATQVLRWSSQTYRIHEVDAGYVPTVSAAIDHYAPEDRPRIAAAVQAGIERGEPWDLELRFVTATGRQIWVRSVGEAELEQGRAVRLLGALQDVTQRKSLKQRLADNERFLRQIADALPVRIAYVDPDGRYRFVNRAHGERFGIAPAEIVGRTRAELTGSADPAVERHVRAVLAGRPQRFEFDEVVRGQRRRIESQLIPDPDEAGTVRGFFSTGIDITERSAAERALRELTTIIDHTTDYVVQTDAHGAITYMNPAARRATGIGPDEPVAHRHFGEFNTPATQRQFVDQIVPAVKAAGVWLGETVVRVAGGRELPVSHMVIAHRDAAGRIERYSAVIRDISASASARQQLERQAATLRSVTEAIPDVVAVVGRDGCYRFANSAFERWCGLPRERILGRPAREVLGEREFERRWPWIARALAGEDVSFQQHYPGRGRAEHLAIVYIPLRLESGEVDGFVVVARDATQQKQEEQRLQRLAECDALTGLLNRAGFEQRLEQAIVAGESPGLALLYIDLDHFKPVNDCHGHPVGDRVLQLFAQRLLNLVRPSDAVARLGGDEFAIALFGLSDVQAADAVAQKVLAAAHAPFDAGALRLNIGASVGVASGAEAAADWRELIARADRQLLHAKASGRGRVARAGVRTGGD